MVRHIVFWKIKDDTHKQANLERMRELILALTGSISGVVSTEIGFNFSSSDYDIILDAVFMDPFALKQFEGHPDNERIKKFTDGILIDRVVCDYMISETDTLTKSTPTTTDYTKTSTASASTLNSVSTGASDYSSSSGSSRLGTLNASLNSALGSLNASINNALANNTMAAQTINNGMAAPITPITPVTPVMNPVMAAGTTSINNMSMLNQSAQAGGYNNNLNTYGNTALPSSANSAINNNRASLSMTGNLNAAIMNNAKRETLAVAPSVNDSTFALPYDTNNNNNMNSNDAAFNLPYNNSNAANMNSYDNSNNNYGYNAPAPNARAMSNTGSIPYVNPKPIQPVQNNMQGYNTGSLPPINMNGMGDAYGGNQRQQGMQPQQGGGVETPWKCPHCGKINAVFATVCGCGRRKPPKNGNNQIQQNQRGMYPNNNSYGNDNNMYDNSYRQPANRKPQNLSLPGPGVPANMDPNMYNNDNNMTRIEPRGSMNRSMANTWTCPTCGKANADYVGQCGCGQRKPSHNMNNNDYSNNNQYQSKPPRKSFGRSKQNGGGGGFFRSSGGNNDNYYSQNDVYDMDNNTVITMEPRRGGNTGDSWKCPRCGKVHGNYVGQCGCGQRKPSRNHMAY